VHACSPLIFISLVFIFIFSLYPIKNKKINKKKIKNTEKVRKQVTTKIKKKKKEEALLTTITTTKKIL
jgi:hypothetical protein